MGEEKSWRGRRVGKEEKRRRRGELGREESWRGTKAGRRSRWEERTYRSEPEEDFLEISEGNNLLVHDASRDSPDKGMERLELGFLEDGNKNEALDLLAGRIGQLTSRSGALLEV